VKEYPVTDPATSSTPVVTLRDVTDDDLPIFFEQQLDETANHMAAFTAQDPSDRDAHAAHWKRIRSDDTITLRTIVVGAGGAADGVAGYVASFQREGTPEVSYWLGRSFWGRGIATRALRDFLDLVEVRPLFARVVKDNVASCRVLEKCGFTVAGEDTGFANARGEEVAELIMCLGEA
jgi:RimJ/RimL family protein N-acetyltransferase